MWNFAGFLAFAAIMVGYEWWQERKQGQLLEAELSEVEGDPLAWFPTLEAKRAILHVKGEHSIEGVLTGIYSDCVVLAHARYLLNATDIQPLDGEQVIPRANIEWVEVLSAGTPQP